ncbi:MAG: EF-hand domain-containing protein [Planctomycetia bacterium]|nr:EF-hand domain-containing protein [Planctomycetia bacterium]
MRTLTGIVLTGALLIVVSPATAQRPPADDDLVVRMMEFDKDKDGQLARTEVTDERLLRLFDRADADKDGTVTRPELTALAAREAVTSNRGGPRGGGPGGPGMGPPRPGEILPPMLQDRLGLTPEQKTRVEDLQKEIDVKLGKILTEAQKTQLKEARQRGPGGPGRLGGGGPSPRNDPPR